MESLHQTFKKYSENDEAMKELRRQIKELKTENNDLSEIILNAMESSDVDVYNHGPSNCVFKRKKKISKASINKDTLCSGISHVLTEAKFKNCDNNDEKADFAADYIMNNREEKESFVLERKQNK